MDYTTAAHLALLCSLPQTDRDCWIYGSDRSVGLPVCASLNPLLLAKRQEPFSLRPWELRQPSALGGCMLHGLLCWPRAHYHISRIYIILYVFSIRMYHIYVHSTICYLYQIWNYSCSVIKQVIYISYVCVLSSHVYAYFAYFASTNRVYQVQSSMYMSVHPYVLCQ